MTIPVAKLISPFISGPEALFQIVSTLNELVKIVTDITDGRRTYNSDGSLIRDAVGTLVREPVFVSPGDAITAASITVIASGSMFLPSVGGLYWGSYDTANSWRASRESTGAGGLLFQYHDGSSYTTKMMIDETGELNVKDILFSGSDGPYVVRHSGGTGIVICSGASESLAFFGGTPAGQQGVTGFSALVGVWTGSDLIPVKAAINRIFEILYNYRLTSNLGVLTGP